jgi:hypothetical protein
VWESRTPPAFNLELRSGRTIFGLFFHSSFLCVCVWGSGLVGHLVGWSAGPCAFLCTRMVPGGGLLWGGGWPTIAGHGSGEVVTSRVVGSVPCGLGSCLTRCAVTAGSRCRSGLNYRRRSAGTTRVERSAASSRAVRTCLDRSLTSGRRWPTMKDDRLSPCHVTPRQRPVLRPEPLQIPRRGYAH